VTIKTTVLIDGVSVSDGTMAFIFTTGSGIKHGCSGNDVEDITHFSFAAFTILLKCLEDIDPNFWHLI